MVSYIIIEDERPAYEELKRMITSLYPNYRLTGWADSVEQASVLLSAGYIDLIFMDIHLADGLAFEIFDTLECNIPVIFTTAYNEYALQAFRTGGIDYLLKPVEEHELQRAITRFEKGLVRPVSDNPIRKRHRFVVKIGDTYLRIPVDDVALFYSEDKCTFVTLRSGHSYIVEWSLDSLEQQLEETKFFRISRSHIVNIDAIERCTKLFGGRLRLYIQPDIHGDLTVSRSRVSAFLNWFDGMI